METTSHSSSTSVFDTMHSSSPLFKLEDVHSSSPPPPSAMTVSFENMAQISQDGSDANPIVVHSKPAKKRKSWGQELPQPTTALPPRKRAKTDDEKEQRRIERIKRNRAAAHNSRERKRQETEGLAVLLARAQAELNAYKKLHGPLPHGTVLQQVQLSADEYESCLSHARQGRADSIFSADATPAPSLVDTHSSIDAGASPSSVSMSSPNDLFDFAVPIKEEEDEDMSETGPFSTNLAPVFQLPDSKPALSSLDPTQHSAVMLCDLQCRSSLESSDNNTPWPNPTSNPNPPTTSPSFPASSTTTWWTTLFLTLTTIQLRTFYTTLLVALWTLSPSRMARLMQASALRSTSTSMTSSTTPRLSWRTAAQAQLSAATCRVSQQGALVALQRRMLADAQRRRSEAAAQRQRQVDRDSKAFEVQRCSNARDGDGTEDADRDGVGR